MPQSKCTECQVPLCLDVDSVFLVANQPYCDQFHLRTYDRTKPLIAKSISPLVPSRAEDGELDLILLLPKDYTSLASSTCTCEPFVENTTSVLCEQYRGAGRIVWSDTLTFTLYKLIAVHQAEFFDMAST